MGARRSMGVMRLLQALPLLLGATATATESRGNPGDRELRRLYEVYLEEHGKQGLHADAAAWEAGLRRFERTDAFIRAFSGSDGDGDGTKKSRSFSLRHSRFSDMAEEERAAFFWRPHPDAAHFLVDESLRMTAAEEAALLGWGKRPGGGDDGRGQEELPVSINWASGDNPLGRSVVTPPINQGHCGGCWSIVAASVVESAVALRHGPLTALSAQELLDCDTAWNAGCLGGNPIQSFDFIKDFGLTTAASYPYKAQQLPCRRAEVVPVSSIESYRILRSYDEALLQRAVARQPVAVGVAGQHASFLFYGGGIYDDEGCGTELNHALVLVGYGKSEETGQEFWIAKNSWGRGWGENGFIRLLRGKNLCGLATAPSVPLGAYGGNATALLEARKEQRSSLFPNPFRPGPTAANDDDDTNNAADADQPLPSAPTNRPFDLPAWLKKSIPGLVSIVLLLAVGAYFFGRPPAATSGALQQQQQPAAAGGGRAGYQAVASVGYPGAVEGGGGGRGAGGSRYGAV